MQDRIYCAEQIKIPHDYPEIMRLYSKAALTEQPNNIVQFSIKYFGRLNAEHRAPAPTYQPNLKQLRELYIANKDAPCDKFIEQLEGEVGKERCTQLQNWYAFCQETYHLSTQQSHIVLVLLLCLVTPSLYDALSSLFYVLQGERMGYISGSDFESIIGVLNTVDHRVEITNPQTVPRLAAQADVFFDDVISGLGVVRR